MKARIIYNSKFDEFQIVPEHLWFMKLPDDKKIKEFLSVDLAIAYFNALTQEEN